MYILYVDASGTPDLGGNGDLYVLAGICVHESGWTALQRSFAALKAKYEYPDAPMELHAKDFCCEYTEQKKIPGFEQLDRGARRKAVRLLRDEKLRRTADAETRRALRKKHVATDPFIHLTRQERSKLLEDALDLVGSQDGIRLFAEVVKKSHLFRTTGERDCIRSAFAQVVSRFDAFLTHKNLGYSTDKGMLMMDQEPTNESFIRKLFQGFRENGHPWGAMNHVIEAPFFVDSSTTSGVQAVDLCAYAVRRYVERATTAGTFEEQNFLRIFHRFDREGPRLHGLRHYCQKGSCPCKICVARGHADEEQEATGS